MTPAAAACGAKALEAAAEALAGQGATGPGPGRVQPGRSTFTLPLGASRDVARLQAKVPGLRHPARRRASSTGGPARPGNSLTPAEAKIAALVAEGPDQSADCRPAVPVPPDGSHPCLAHPGQAQRTVPDRHRPRGHRPPRVAAEPRTWAQPATAPAAEPASSAFLGVLGAAPRPAEPGPSARPFSPPTQPGPSARLPSPALQPGPSARLPSPALQPGCPAGLPGRRPGCPARLPRPGPGSGPEGTRIQDAAQGASVK